MSEHFCKEIVKLNKDLHCLAGMSTNFHEIFAVLIFLFAQSVYFRIPWIFWLIRFITLIKLGLQVIKMIKMHR